MYNIEIIIIAIIAILARIYIQKGSFILPTIYKEGNNVRFNWGSVGVLIVGLITVLFGGFIDPSILNGPVTTQNLITVFSLVYTLPALSDGIITKALPGSEDGNTDKEIQNFEEDYV